jgi:transposase
MARALELDPDLAEAHTTLALLDSESSGDARGLEGDLRKAVELSPGYHPGVGPITGLTYVLVIGTPERFPCGKQIGSYVGLIPSEDSSAGHQRLGHISKQGNALLRYLLGEASQAAARKDTDWRRRYVRLAMRRQKSVPELY